MQNETHNPSVLAPSHHTVHQQIVLYFSGRSKNKYSFCSQSSVLVTALTFLTFQ